MHTTVARPWSWIGAISAMAMLAGCQGCPRPGKLTKVIVTNATCNGSVCGVARLDSVRIEVHGEGVCSEFKMSLGNGSFPISDKNFDFSKGPRVYNLTFETGWPGPKTITAEGVSNCVGKVTTLHHVFTQSGSVREDFMLGIASPRQMCFNVPNSGTRFPPLRPNTRVAIVSPTTPKVDYGCAFGGCIYDADGKPGSSAGSNFSFPGFKEYSLILTVGNQTVQGGTNVNFVANQAGELLVCFNDGYMYDNSGGMEVDISIDESQAQ